MMTIMKSDKNIEDARLRELLDRSLPEAPHDEWFVRKVMNRLPEREAPMHTRIEKMSYIIAVLLLVGYAVWFYLGVREAGVVSWNDVLTSAAIAAVGAAVVISFYMPRIRAWINE